MKKLRVFGHTTVTVSTVVTVPDNASEADIYKAAAKKFSGINSYLGNGGDDKLLGVSGEDDTMLHDEPVVFDDYSDNI